MQRTITYKMEYEGGDNNNVEVGVKTPLEDNGDFRNKECLNLLDERDIVVTNLPFSFARAYVQCLREHGKQFVIIRDLNWNIVRNSLKLSGLRQETSEDLQELLQSEEKTVHTLTGNFDMDAYLFKRKCNGIIGVSITFMDKYNPDEFEIVGMNLNNSVEELGIKEIGNEWVELYKKQSGKGHITASMHSFVYTHNGKAISLYRRVLIRRKVGA